jgi:hypothetical protein
MARRFREEDHEPEVPYGPREEAPVREEVTSA